MIRPFLRWRKKRKQDWEDICRKCGLCCFEKDEGLSGTWYIDLNKPCRYLDKISRHCSVYDDRFKICRECVKMTIFHALFADYLPDSCAYVQKYIRWRRFIGLN